MLNSEGTAVVGPGVTLYCGDARAVLATLPAGVAQCCVCSPPYFAKRNYATEAQVWADGWRGELGQERTVDAYVAHLVAVFRAVKRVLRPDGTLWVNLGDSYSNAGRSNRAGTKRQKPGWTPDTGVGEKQLLLVPARFALAMQAAGWVLRNALTLCKVAPMPESATDRFTSATEMLYLFAQRPRYYIDMTAVAEPAAESTQARAYLGQRPITPQARALQESGAHGASDRLAVYDRATRNPRDWRLWRPEAYDGAHYAAYPTWLPALAITAGSSAKGQCSVCSAPWRRVVERGMPTGDRPQAARARELFQAHGLTEAHLAAIRAVGLADAGKALVTMDGAGHNVDAVQRLADEAKAAVGGYYREFCFGGSPVTTGWAPTCKHADAPVCPQVVLDPFAGTGTTLGVARQLGRHAIGIDLQPDYIPQQEARLAAMLPWYAEGHAAALDGWGDLPLFAEVAS